MTIDASALRTEASAVCQAQLLRARGRLKELTRTEQRAVEEMVQAVGLGVVACLLEGAADDERLEAVLSGLYPPGGMPSAPG
jgi:hypothetical protein